MPSQMDVIGRITRVNVWEYIKKLKKSPTKEVVIVNIFPASPILGSGVFVVSRTIIVS